MLIDNDLFKRIYSSKLLYGNRMKRVDTQWPNVSSERRARSAAIGQVGRGGLRRGRAGRHRGAVSRMGLSTQEIVEIFAARGERLSEATFRKYVQQGLLPRSVRVGRKGKHRGSQGRYPASVVRQIEAVRALMAQGFTIQDIQREFLCVRSDIDALSRLRVASDRHAGSRCGRTSRAARTARRHARAQRQRRARERGRAGDEAARRSSNDWQCVRAWRARQCSERTAARWRSATQRQRGTEA